MSVQLSSTGVGRLRGVLSRRLSLAGRVVYALAATVAAVASSMMVVSAMFVGQAAQWVAYALFIASFVIWFRRKRAPGTIRIDAGVLHVERPGLSLHVPTSDVDSAFVVPHEAGPPTVELLMKNGDELACEVRDVEEGRAIVSALDFGPGKRRVRIPFATPRRRLLHPLFGMLVSWVAGIGATFLSLLMIMRDARIGPDASNDLRAVGAILLSAFAIFVAYPFVKRLARAPEITIADDGIVYTAGRKTRFIPREKIWSVEQPHPKMATMIRSDGPPIIIMGTGIDADRRVAATWLLFERREPPPQANATHFARGGRSIQEWREHLRRAMDPTYRAAGTSPDDAEATLRSPAASIDEKIGAAIALRVSGAEPARIRIAAEGTAQDPLRDAINAIADDATDEVVEKKLARVRSLP